MLLYTLFRETHLYTVIFASSFCFHAALISFKEEKRLRSSCFATSNKCDYNAFTTESSPNLHLFFLYSYSTFFTKTMSPCQHFYLFSLRIWKFGSDSALGFFSLSRNATDYASPHRCSLFRRSSCPGRTLASRGSVSRQ